MCITLGRRLYQKYLCAIRQKNGFMEKLRLLYDDYMKHEVTNERFQVSERQKWNELVKEKFAYMVNRIDTIFHLIGSFLSSGSN